MFHVSLEAPSFFPSAFRTSRAMLGISYGELFLILGATAAVLGMILDIPSLFGLHSSSPDPKRPSFNTCGFLNCPSRCLGASIAGPKDLPIIARTAGRLAGRAVGYVQLARGQLDNVLQASQANKVHKELQDTMAQLEAIRYEIRSLSIMQPGPLTRQLIDNPDLGSSPKVGNDVAEKLTEEQQARYIAPKDPNAGTSASLHSQAMAYARLAEGSTRKAISLNSIGDDENLDDGSFTVLPISAESAGLLPNQRNEIKGSDIVLGAIVEADVAKNAKHFFSQPQNQIPRQ